MFLSFSEMLLPQHSRFSSPSPKLWLVASRLATRKRAVGFLLLVPELAYL
jgi:hypothetical protein